MNENKQDNISSFIAQVIDRQKNSQINSQLNSQLNSQQVADFQKMLEQCNSNSIWNQPYVHPQPLDISRKDEVKIKGIMPYTRTAKPLMNKEYFEVMEKMKQQWTNPMKSQFEEIIDFLFSLEEKMEYLKSVGYRHLDNSSYLVKGEEPDPEFKRTYTVDQAFLIEITIKFKNLLLSKGTLKIKF